MSTIEAKVLTTYSPSPMDMGEGWGEGYIKIALYYLTKLIIWKAISQFKCNFNPSCDAENPSIL